MMSHWYTQGSLAREHHADLDREAMRAALVGKARVARETGAEPTTQRPLVVRSTAWIRERIARVARMITRRSASSPR
jgi:hypothetical protein